uniref:Chitin-binding type-2 domain-containing protein n=2 Tax=Cacopsylla melanoneura TaxID=428564 RepID=A0A8D9BDI3_9HEMI
MTDSTTESVTQTETVTESQTQTTENGTQTTDSETTQTTEGTTVTGTQTTNTIPQTQTTIVMTETTQEQTSMETTQSQTNKETETTNAITQTTNPQTTNPPTDTTQTETTNPPATTISEQTQTTQAETETTNAQTTSSELSQTTQTETETTNPQTTVPQTTNPQTTVPQTTNPQTTDTTNPQTTDAGSTDSTTPAGARPVSSNCPELEPDQMAIVCPTGFRRHPMYCNLFYQCTVSSTNEMKVVVLTCTNGTVYDDKKIQCLPRAEAAPCGDLKVLEEGGSRKKRMHDLTVPPVPVSSKKKLCPKSGVFAYEQDCQMFYKCKRSLSGKMQGELYQCPEGTSFWESTSKCEVTKNLPKKCKRGTFTDLWKNSPIVPFADKFDDIITISSR